MVDSNTTANIGAQAQARETLLRKPARYVQAALPTRAAGFIPLWPKQISPAILARMGCRITDFQVATQRLRNLSVLVLLA